MTENEIPSETPEETHDERAAFYRKLQWINSAGALLFVCGAYIFHQGLAVLAGWILLGWGIVKLVGRYRKFGRL